MSPRGTALVDVHCHILPGLDDGPRTLDESVRMARIAADAGFAAIVATPHVMPGVFDAASDEIARAAADLQAECNRLGISISILPGCEVYLEENVPGLVRDGRLLPVGSDKRHLLVELPQHDVPHYTRDLLFRVSLAGYTPVLAHPERNAALRENKALASEIAAAGVLFQLNAGSLLGVYGRRTRQVAEKWVDDGMYSMVGSDWHGPDGPNALVEVLKPGYKGIDRLLAGNLRIASPLHL